MFQVVDQNSPRSEWIQQYLEPLFPSKTHVHREVIKKFSAAT